MISPERIVAVCRIYLPCLRFRLPCNVWTSFSKNVKSGIKGALLKPDRSLLLSWIIWIKAGGLANQPSNVAMFPEGLSDYWKQSTKIVVSREHDLYTSISIDMVATPSASDAWTHEKSMDIGQVFLPFSECTTFLMHSSMICVNQVQRQLTFHMVYPGWSFFSMNILNWGTF